MRGVIFSAENEVDERPPGVALPQTPGFCEAWQRTQNAGVLTLPCCAVGILPAARYFGDSERTELIKTARHGPGRLFEYPHDCKTVLRVADFRWHE